MTRFTHLLLVLCSGPRSPSVLFSTIFRVVDRVASINLVDFGSGVFVLNIGKSVVVPCRVVFRVVCRWRKCVHSESVLVRIVC
jgi:hypothetical protein